MRPSVFELEVERPLAVVYVALERSGSHELGEVSRALESLSGGLDNWARTLAALLARDQARLAKLLRLVRLGVRPREPLLEEARALLSV